MFCRTEKSSFSSFFPTKSRCGFLRKEKKDLITTKKNSIMTILKVYNLKDYFPFAYEMEMGYEAYILKANKGWLSNNDIYKIEIQPEGNFADRIINIDKLNYQIGNTDIDTSKEEWKNILTLDAPKELWSNKEELFNAIVKYLNLIRLSADEYEIEF